MSCAWKNLNLVNSHKLMNFTGGKRDIVFLQGIKFAYSSLFADKIPIFPNLFPIFLGKFLFFGHFAFNFGILYSFYHYCMRKHSFKFLASLCLASKYFLAIPYYNP